jgi:hypothetical protein
MGFSTVTVFSFVSAGKGFAGSIGARELQADIAMQTTSRIPESLAVTGFSRGLTRNAGFAGGAGSCLARGCCECDLVSLIVAM